MQRPDFRTLVRSLRRLLENAWRTTRRVVVIRTFWLGIAGIVAFWFGLLLLVDHLVMPAYTRHGAQLSVPDARNLPLAEAQRLLQEQGLTPEVVVQRYDPAKQRDLVLQQDPPPNAVVKPGRGVYLTVNAGSLPQVVVPDLQFVSLREAKSRLTTQRLTLGTVSKDSLPSPFANTITRQEPTPGDSVARGTPVHVWVSTGPGRETVEVPQVTDLHLREAKQALARARLRFVLLEDPSVPVARMDTIARQSPEPGSQVQVGSEVRLYALVSEAALNPDSTDAQER